MSKYLSATKTTLKAYVPGEQPQDKKYIKLNTNESPYAPSKKAIKGARAAAKKLELYPDPEVKGLIARLAKLYDVDADCVLTANGSDEALNFVYMAYCDKETPAVFPDISYGFYPVFAALNNVPYREIPLNGDFRIDVEDYIGARATIFIANPNAPTGIALSLADIERIVQGNRDNIVVIDEAYVDFGAETAVPLTKKYNNLIVVQTFSKSRSMAGARLGCCIADASLIADLKRIKYSVNPYNVNTMTYAAAVGVLDDEEYTRSNCARIAATRAYVAQELSKLGCTVLDSKANFIFYTHPSIGGEELYLALKQRGILIRHFKKERIKDYNRVTIGSEKQMRIFVSTIKSILEEV